MKKRHKSSEKLIGLAWEVKEQLIQLERCKGSVELLDFTSNASQQDRRFSFRDGYLISMKPYPKGLPEWLLEPPESRSALAPMYGTVIHGVSKSDVDANTKDNTEIKKIFQVENDIKVARRAPLMRRPRNL